MPPVGAQWLLNIVRFWVSSSCVTGTIVSDIGKEKIVRGRQRKARNERRIVGREIMVVCKT